MKNLGFHKDLLSLRRSYATNPAAWASTISRESRWQPSRKDHGAYPRPCHSLSRHPENVDARTATACTLRAKGDCHSVVVHRPTGNRHRRRDRGDLPRGSGHARRESGRCHPFATLRAGSGVGGTKDLLRYAPFRVDHPARVTIGACQIRHPHHRRNRPGCADRFGGSPRCSSPSPTRWSTRTRTPGKRWRR
jgi:hypothetical protein